MCNIVYNLDSIWVKKKHQSTGFFIISKSPYQFSGSHVRYAARPIYWPRVSDVVGFREGETREIDMTRKSLPVHKFPAELTIRFNSRHVQQVLLSFPYTGRERLSSSLGILERTGKLKPATNNIFRKPLILPIIKSLEKLQKYGIRGPPRQWLTSCLTNRQQSCSINNQGT